MVGLEKENRIYRRFIDMPFEAEFGEIDRKMVAHLTRSNDERDDLRQQPDRLRADPQPARIRKDLTVAQQNDIVAINREALVKHPGHQGGLARARWSGHQEPLALPTRASGMNFGEFRQRREREFLHS